MRSNYNLRAAAAAIASAAYEEAIAQIFDARSSSASPIRANARESRSSSPTSSATLGRLDEAQALLTSGLAAALSAEERGHGRARARSTARDR